VERGHRRAVDVACGRRHEHKERRAQRDRARDSEPLGGSPS
jgi:hypothetical protein